MKRRLLLTHTSALVAAATLGGCASQNLSDYASEKPVLDLAQYFNGTLDAWGVFSDRSGKVVRRFEVVMKCSWQGNQGVLEEDFVFSDGGRQKRIWRLTKLDNGRYTGRADDVVGEANGQVSGNAFHWTYTLQLPVDGKLLEVQLDDWMYLVNDNIMLNKAVMRKFGIQVGELTLSFSKRALP